jgi:hypothetical protein
LEEIHIFGVYVIVITSATPRLPEKDREGKAVCFPDSNGNQKIQQQTGISENRDKAKLRN